MRTLNSISDNTIFKSTNLYDHFVKKPIGFVDIGAAGGAHSLVSPVASITNCLCFEANLKAAKELQAIGTDIYSNFVVYNNAIASKNGSAIFYITESEVNSSLLKPGAEMVDRYNNSGMKVRETIKVATRTLDSIIREVGKTYYHPGEIIKLDCQGAEYGILCAARETLAKQCVAIWCEVLFFQIYKKQNNFFDINKLLSSKGFTLYGLYPKYISKKMLDRTKYETNERLMWADAFYIKDPLSCENKTQSFTEREIDVLILIALLTGFFDYAMEIIEVYKDDTLEKIKLNKFIRLLARRDKIKINRNTEIFMEKCRQSPNHTFLFAKKFIDENKKNNDVDFLTVD